jgi:uncharacterized protein (TIGR02001 family)
LFSLADPGAARAQLSGYVALMTDYRYRGVSYSDRRPSLQGGLDYQHASGIFIGALAATVRIKPYISGVGGQVYGGYAHALSENWTWEAGVISNLYPHPTYGPSYNYTEGFVGLTYKNVNARAYYTDSYEGGGRAGYFELNASRPLSERVVLFGHLGYLTHRESRPPAYSATSESFFDAKLGLSIEVHGFHLELSVTGTTAKQAACPLSGDQCGTTGLIAISKSF